MKMNKKISALFFVLFAFLLVMQGTSALKNSLIEDNFRVEMDGIRLDEHSETLIAFDRNEDFDIRVFFALDDSSLQQNENYYKNVQIEARIRGYRFTDTIGDITRAFNVHPNTTYNQRLNIKTPIRMDSGLYKLRITISDAFGKEVSKTYDLRIVEQRSGMWIREIIFNPSDSVQAGRALLASVRVRNIGEIDQRHGVRINVAIPDLQVSATDYINELRVDETITSEELYLRIPSCAKPGIYNARIEVVYDDGDERLVEYKQIEVTKGEFCEDLTVPIVPPKDEKPVIEVSAEVQELMAGVGGAVYPISIKNKDNVAKTFTLLVDAESWATVRVSPSNLIVVQPGQTSTAYVYVSASKDTLIGQNLFAVTVKSGTFSEQVVLVANVVPAEKSETWSSLKSVLEIGLVVLVVLLVILGLVIGLRKMKKGESNEDEEQSYY